MLDSASVHNENYPVVLHTGETKPQQEPDVRKSLNLPRRFVVSNIVIFKLERKTFSDEFNKFSKSAVSQGLSN